MANEKENETHNTGPITINDDPADNPNEPYNEYHRKKEAHLHRKMNYSDDEKAFIKQVTKHII